MIAEKYGMDMFVVCLEKLGAKYFAETFFKGEVYVDKDKQIYKAVGLFLFLLKGKEKSVDVE